MRAPLPVPLLCPLPAVGGGGLARTRYGDAAAGGRNGNLPAPSAGHAGGKRRQWSSDQLFGDHQEIEIAHGDSVYRLRVTSLGKLILTK